MTMATPLGRRLGAGLGMLVRGAAAAPPASAPGWDALSSPYTVQTSISGTSPFDQMQYATAPIGGDHYLVAGRNSGYLGFWVVKMATVAPMLEVVATASPPASAEYGGKLAGGRYFHLLPMGGGRFVFCTYAGTADEDFYVVTVGSDFSLSVGPKQSFATRFGGHILARPHFFDPDAGRLLIADGSSGGYSTAVVAVLTYDGVGFTYATLSLRGVSSSMTYPANAMLGMNPKTGRYYIVASGSGGATRYYLEFTAAGAVGTPKTAGVRSSSTTDGVVTRGDDGSLWWVECPNGLTSGGAVAPNNHLFRWVNIFSLVPPEDGGSPTVYSGEHLAPHFGAAWIGVWALAGRCFSGGEVMSLITTGAAVESNGSNLTVYPGHPRLVTLRRAGGEIRLLGGAVLLPRGYDFSYAFFRTGTTVPEFRVGGWSADGDRVALVYPRYGTSGGAQGTHLVVTTFE